jgi:pimeloyl-ACP methyl ester carboxylesterase
MAEETGPAGFVRQQKAIMGRPDSRPGLGAIAVPTLVLVGEDDILTPPAEAYEMAMAIPGATLVEISACGHLATLEAPEAVTAALEHWLAA